ncbi:hypothetical protein CMV_023284, partial [Castanea mollissima]
MAINHIFPDICGQ